MCNSAQTRKLSCKREEVPQVPEDVTLCALLSVYTRCQPSSCKAVSELHRRTTGKWNRALFSWSSRPLGSAQGSSWRHTLNVCGQDISFKIDTGADVSVISWRTYQSIKHRPKLRPTEISQHSPGELMQVMGQFESVTAKNVPLRI